MAELTKIEKIVIQKVKDKRNEFNISNMSDSFVGNVETPDRRAKYNIKHLNALAKIFKCSPRDLLPEKSM